MKYKKLKFKNYNLHLIKTNDFKTISIKACFKRKLKEDEILYRCLLAQVLTLGTMKYPKERTMEMHCEDLYDFSYSISTTKSGYYHIISFAAKFLNEKYTEKSMNEKSIEFLKEIVFNPLVIDESFSEENVSRAKKVLYDDLVSIEEDPSKLLSIKLLRETEKSVYTTHPYFLKDKIDSITSKQLYEYYKTIFKKDNIDVFVVGDIDDSIIKYLKKDNIGYNRYHNHYVKPKKIRKRVKKVTEIGNFNQSKLGISFKFKDLTDFERRYVLNIYSFILGGGSDSKLFKKIREENSLCYYIYSTYNSNHDYFEINAGINSKNKDKTLVLIKEMLKEMELGKFSKEDINKAKMTYISACNEITDSQDSILNSYINHEYLKTDLISEKKKKIKKVTKKDIVNLSKKINIDTIYLLKGDKENEEN